MTAPRRDSHRIAVVGNCQAAGFSDCLRVWLPQAEIVLFDLTQLGPAPGATAAAMAIMAQLDGFPLVFSHAVHGERFGPLDYAQLRVMRPDVVFIPNLAFTGFHPDCVNLSAGGHVFRGPLDVYQSALAAVAFDLGLSAERTLRLFNPLVLRRLGYADEYAQAVVLLGRQFAICGIEEDLAPRLANWSRDGAFMYTINHPRLHAIADTARLLLSRIGLGEFPLDATAGLPDRLARMACWPVYPVVAKAIGVPGSWAFQPSRDAAPLSLEAFIDRSFASFAATPEALHAALHANPAVARVLRRLPKLLDRVP